MFLEILFLVSCLIILYVVTCFIASSSILIVRYAHDIMYIVFFMNYCFVYMCIYVIEGHLVDWLN